MREKTIQQKILVCIALAGCKSNMPTDVSQRPIPPVTLDAQMREEKTGYLQVMPVDFSHNEGDIRMLCEPHDSRWEWPTEKQRAQAKVLILATCEAMGVSQETCKYFKLVSGRESSYRWWARHKKFGDVSSAAGAYLSESEVYGWRAEWKYRARKHGEVEKIELWPLRGKNQNPYYPQALRFFYGLGLGGLNVPYQLQKIDPMAPPEILCDPVLNTMVQVQISRSAVRRYGAKNFVEVQAIFAGRTDFDDRGKAIPGHNRKKDLLFLRRCRAYGLDCYSKPDFGRHLDIDRMTPEQIYSAADAIRKKPLPKFDKMTSPQVIVHTEQRDP